MRVFFKPKKIFCKKFFRFFLFFFDYFGFLGLLDPPGAWEMPWGPSWWKSRPIPAESDELMAASFFEIEKMIILKDERSFIPRPSYKCPSNLIQISRVICKHVFTNLYRSPGNSIKCLHKFIQSSSENRENFCANLFNFHHIFVRLSIRIIFFKYIVFRISIKKHIRFRSNFKISYKCLSFVTNMGFYIKIRLVFIQSKNLDFFKK